MAGTQDHQEYRRSGIRAVQSTPLRSRSGRPLGMLSTHWRTPHDPTDEDFRFFDVLARQAADLIERTLAEEALSTVSQKLIEAHEEERTRIGRELHDDISQQLALVSLRLGCLKQSPPASAAGLGQEIGEVFQQMADLASDVQSLSHGLHSPKLDLLGLEGAMAGLCEELSDRSGVTIDVHFENVPKALPRGNLSVPLPRPAGSPAECRQAWPVAARPRLSERTYRHHRPDGQGFGCRLSPSRGDARARARVGQHEGAVEDRGRGAFHPLAAGLRHDGSRGRASPCPAEACKPRSIDCRIGELRASLDIAGSPRLVEERLQRTVETKDDGPPLPGQVARNGSELGTSAENTC